LVSSSVLLRHCNAEFIKQVLPRLFKPETPLGLLELLFSLPDHNPNPNPLFVLLEVVENAGELEAVKLPKPVPNICELDDEADCDDHGRSMETPPFS
jgi:hypothetical protein